MQLRSDDFPEMQAIPQRCAFGRPGSAGEPCVGSDNCSPHLAWSDAPAATRSFVLTCIDADAPTSAGDVNQTDRQVRASLPRAEFVHWLMIDIPPECRELAYASCSDGVVAHGKRAPHGPPGSIQGRNDYGNWFAGDASMAGDYFGYDGPCPPWNDQRLHHYHFRVHAMDVASLGLGRDFSVAELRAAMHGHVLAEATLTGTYTLNPALLR